MVGHGDDGGVGLRGHVGEEGVAGAARSVFVAGERARGETALMQRHPPVRGQGGHKFGVGSRVGAQGVIEVGDVQGQLPLRSVPRQQMEQADAVRAAANAHDDDGAGRENEVIHLELRKGKAEWIGGGGCQLGRWPVCYGHIHTAHYTIPPP